MLASRSVPCVLGTVVRKHDVTLLIIVSTGLRLSAGDVNMVLQRLTSGVMCRNRQVNNGRPDAEAAHAKSATIPSKALQSIEIRGNGVLQRKRRRRLSLIRACWGDWKGQAVKIARGVLGRRNQWTTD